MKMKVAVWVVARIIPMIDPTAQGIADHMVVARTIPIALGIADLTEVAAAVAHTPVTDQPRDLVHRMMMTEVTAGVGHTLLTREVVPRILMSAVEVSDQSLHLLLPVTKKEVSSHHRLLQMIKTAVPSRSRHPLYLLLMAKVEA